MGELAEALGEPLPKGVVEYARHRLVEALVEAVLALEFLKAGFHRNAAGKAFQAWKALLAAYVALERDRLLRLAEVEEDRRLLGRRSILTMPTGAMAAVSEILEEAGHRDISQWTYRALALHRYQYNGPDPGGELSPFRSPRAAAKAALRLIRATREYALRLRDRAWSDPAERALKELEDRLTALGGP